MISTNSIIYIIVVSTEIKYIIRLQKNNTIGKLVDLFILYQQGEKKNHLILWNNRLELRDICQEMGWQLRTM